MPKMTPTMTPSFTQEIERKINECRSNPDILQGLAELIKTAKILHAEERNISLLPALGSVRFGWWGCLRKTTVRLIAC